VAGATAVRSINLDLLAQKPVTGGDGSATLSPGSLEKGDDAADLLARGWTAAHMALLRARNDFLNSKPSPRAKESNGEALRKPFSSGACEETALRPRFEFYDDGLYVNEVRNGAPLPRSKVCERFEVPALVRDPANCGWGSLLEFLDPDRSKHRVIVPHAALRGEGLEALSLLMDRGFVPRAGRDRYLIEYLREQRSEKRARVTNRTGWHGDPLDAVFVLPELSIGAREERWLFQSDAPAQTFKTRGTSEGWRDEVSRLCIGNSRLLFAVSVAFAAPLLYVAGAESGGFHFRGLSSSGKTTFLRIGASVCGAPDSFMQRWRATDNGLEALALQHCDAPLYLDEIAQIDPRVAGEVAYMLANGGGKQRAARTGGMRERASWRLLFVSAGEIGLAEHMQEVGKRARAGQELRLCDIPADAGAGLGCFENLHDHANGSEFARALDRAARQNYGTAFAAFLTRLTQERENLPAFLREGVHRFERQYLTGSASGQAQRVAARFALVGLAGELATDYGVTAWARGDALSAAGVCFRAWLESRGGEGNQEERAMLAQVREFFERHGEARFADWERTAMTDDHAPRVINKAGFRKHDGAEDKTEWFVYPNVFKTEVCKGFDPRAVSRLLLARGFLNPADKDHAARSLKLPGEGQRRVYHVLPALMESDDA
ncbi:MAG: DUF927 domain-containing protein, partial [Burkholderiales bacterium]